MARGTALLCAGGTGGHLFPAEALARVLAGRGWRVELATDHRATGYGGEFPASAIHIVSSGTVTGQGLAGRAAGAARLAWGALQALRLMRRVRPSVVVGFGGYPTVPPMLAASLAKVPTVIHDQNAVLGRANRFLAPRMDRIATSSGRVGLAEAVRGKAVETGNPIRDAVLRAAGRPYRALEADGPLRLLVFGGSQGARFLSEIVPAALERLPAGLRGRLELVQQCRVEDLEAVRKTCARLGVTAELRPFFHDLPDRIAHAHLVISRSGASTVAELAAIGRPAIMIPLPHALDHDQKANAEILSAAGGGWLIPQADLTAERLATEIAALAADPVRLMAAAAAAKRQGRPDAAERLADLVEGVAARPPAPLGAAVASMKSEASGKGVDA